jgi:hypothetical protein
MEQGVACWAFFADYSFWVLGTFFEPACCGQLD